MLCCAGVCTTSRLLWLVFLVKQLLDTVEVIAIAMLDSTSTLVWQIGLSVTVQTVCQQCDCLVLRVGHLMEYTFHV